MAYQVVDLERKPSVWDDVISGFTEGLNDAQYRSVVNKMLNDKKYESTAEFNPKTGRMEYTFKEKKPEKIMLEVIGGLSSPSDYYTPEVISQAAGLSLGGPANTPAGATVAYPEGEMPQILGPGGERIGEFAPGYEPQPNENLFVDLLRQSTGIGKDEAMRKSMGLSQKKEEKPSYENDLRAVKEGQSSWDELVAKYPSKVNSIRKTREALSYPNESTYLVYQKIKENIDNEVPIQDIAADIADNSKEYESYGVDVEWLVNKLGIPKEGILHKITRKGEEFKKKIEPITDIIQPVHGAIGRGLSNLLLGK